MKKDSLKISYEDNYFYVGLFNLDIIPNENFKKPFMYIKHKDTPPSVYHYTNELDLIKFLRIQYAEFHKGHADTIKFTHERFYDILIDILMNKFIDKIPTVDLTDTEMEDEFFNSILSMIGIKSIDISPNDSNIFIIESIPGGEVSLYTAVWSKKDHNVDYLHKVLKKILINSEDKDNNFGMIPIEIRVLLATNAIFTINKKLGIKYYDEDSTPSIQKSNDIKEDTLRFIVNESPYMNIYIPIDPRVPRDEIDLLERHDRRVKFIDLSKNEDLLSVKIRGYKVENMRKNSRTLDKDFMYTLDLKIDKEFTHDTYRQEFRDLVEFVSKYSKDYFNIPSEKEYTLLFKSIERLYFADKYTDEEIEIMSLFTTEQIERLKELASSTNIQGGSNVSPFTSEEIRGLKELLNHKNNESNSNTLNENEISELRKLLRDKNTQPSQPPVNEVKLSESEIRSVRELLSRKEEIFTPQFTTEEATKIRALINNTSSSETHTPSVREEEVSNIPGEIMSTIGHERREEVVLNNTREEVLESTPTNNVFSEYEVDRIKAIVNDFTVDRLAKIDALTKENTYGLLNYLPTLFSAPTASLLFKTFVDNFTANDLIKLKSNQLANEATSEAKLTSDEITQLKNFVEVVPSDNYNVLATIPSNQFNIDEEKINTLNSLYNNMRDASRVAYLGQLTDALDSDSISNVISYIGNINDKLIDSQKLLKKEDFNTKLHTLDENFTNEKLLALKDIEPQFNDTEKSILSTLANDIVQEDTTKIKSLADKSTELLALPEKVANIETKQTEIDNKLNQRVLSSSYEGESL